VVGLPVVNPDYREVTDAQSTTTHRADAARHTDGGPLCTPPSLPYCADNTEYRPARASGRRAVGEWFGGVLAPQSPVCACAF